MERVVMIGLASVLLVGQAAFAGMPLISSDAFVRLSVDSSQITLPDAAPVGAYSGGAKLNVQVTSNRPYQVRVGFDGFVDRKGGTAIRKQDTALVVNRVSVPVGRSPVPVYKAGRTTVQGSHVPLDLMFSVRNLHFCSAGNYSGQFVVAIAVAR